MSMASTTSSAVVTTAPYSMTDWRSRGASMPTHAAKSGMTRRARIISVFSKLVHRKGGGVDLAELSVHHGEEFGGNRYPQRDVDSDGELECEGVLNPNDGCQEHHTVLEREHADDGRECPSAITHQEECPEYARKKE